MEEIKRKSFNCCLVFVIICLVLGFGIGIYLAVRNHQTALSRSNCELPCWQGIIVGETSRDEVIKAFSNLSFVDYRDITRNGAEQNGYSDQINFELYSDFTNYSKVYGVISFLDKKVTKITAAGNIGLSLEQNIKKFGEPEFVYINRYQGIQLHLFYPEIGMVFRIDTDNKNPYVIEGSLKIKEFDIVEISEFRSFVDKYVFFPNGEYNASQVQPWRGYGEIEDKYGIFMRSE